jgi:hypothetical protein
MFELGGLVIKLVFLNIPKEDVLLLLIVVSIEILHLKLLRLLYLRSAIEVIVIIVEALQSLVNLNIILRI